MLGRLALDPQPRPARDWACEVGMGQCSVSAALLHARGARTLGSRAAGTIGREATAKGHGRAAGTLRAGRRAGGRTLCWRLGSAGGPVWFESHRATRGSGSVLSRWISSMWIMSIYRAALLIGVVVHGMLVQRGLAA